MSGPGRKLPAAWYLLGGLLLANLALWKFRIIDTGTNPQLTIGVGDLYIEHYPMTQFAFESIAAGKIPLWNPFQLMGTPFLALPNVGLFYPGNWLYAFVDTGIGIELSLIAHLCWAGLGMFLFARSVSFSVLASVAAAITFSWSGWMMSNVNHPPLITGVSWLPMTMLAVEYSLRGSGRAALGLIAAVAFQLFNGAPELFLQNMTVCGGYALLRLGAMLAGGETTVAVRRAGLLLGSVLVGVFLAAPQVLPTLELLSESVRIPGLSFRAATKVGVVYPQSFIPGALTSSKLLSVGFLPLAGIILGSGTRHRLLWGYLLLLALAATFLSFGGEFYRLYHETPLGSMFRRPVKFLHSYAFALSLLAGLTVVYLENARDRELPDLLRSPAFLLCVVALGTAAAWVADRGVAAVSVIGLLVGLLIYAVARPPRLRWWIVVGLVALQGTTLFFETHQRFVRPSMRPERMQAQAPLLARLRELGPNHRVYVNPQLSVGPGLVQRTGTPAGIRFLGDYNPLASQRASTFFSKAAPSKPGAARARRVFGGPFVGHIVVDARSNWSLLDLTSTRYYVARAASVAGRFLRRLTESPDDTGLRRLKLGRPSFVVAERESALPRAYFVPEGLFVYGPMKLLRTLVRTDFDPYAEVLLEDERFIGAAGPRSTTGISSVEIVEDGTEKIVLEVESTVPGFAVLNDSYYPGWEARIGSTPTDLYRANYLFRAVRVPVGRSVITMEYRPASFRLGLALAGGAAVLLVLVVLGLRRFPRSRGGADAATSGRRRFDSESS